MVEGEHGVERHKRDVAEQGVEHRNARATVVVDSTPRMRQSRIQLYVVAAYTRQRLVEVSHELRKTAMQPSTDFLLRSL